MFKIISKHTKIELGRSTNKKFAEEIAKMFSKQYSNTEILVFNYTKDLKGNQVGAKYTTKQVASYTNGKRN